MKRNNFFALCFLAITLIVGGFTADASNYGNPLTQYALVDASSGMASLRSKGDMARILKSLGFKIVSNGKTFKAVRNNTTVTLTKIRNGDKCVVNFGTQSEANQFVESMIKSKWSRIGGTNVYQHPDCMFGGGVQATVNGRTITLVFEWDGDI